MGNSPAISKPTDSDFSEDCKLSPKEKRIAYDNGDIYVGEMQTDFRQGEGIMKYANGDIYHGHYTNDKRQSDG